MKALRQEEFIERTEAWRAEGHRVDSRLDHAIGASTAHVNNRLEDSKSLLSLIWHEIDRSRILTPAGQPRTLRDVATYTSWD